MANPNLQLFLKDFLDFNSAVQSDQDLIEYDEFPEPLLKVSTAKLKKWQDLYIQRLVNEDIRDFSKVQYDPVASHIGRGLVK